MKSPQIIIGECPDALALLPPKSVALTICSPPYAGKGERYGAGVKWSTRGWVDWMYLVVNDACRVTTNAVVIVANGFVRDGKYHPACEGLIWRCFEAGIVCERPAIWHKNAPPNRKDWFGNDWEFCMVFRPEDSTRYFDWQAIATPPKYKAGGRFRQRTANGARRLGSEYPTGKLTRPRDVLRVTVGGRHLGSELAHENEAPYPEKLVEPFVLALTKPGETVLDPFCGSGTSLAVALKHGRRAIGIDIRTSQGDLTRRRIEEVTA